MVRAFEATRAEEGASSSSTRRGQEGARRSARQYYIAQRMYMPLYVWIYVFICLSLSLYIYIYIMYTWNCHSVCISLLFSHTTLRVFYFVFDQRVYLVFELYRGYRDTVLFRFRSTLVYCFHVYGVTLLLCFPSTSLLDDRGFRGLFGILIPSPFSKHVRRGGWLAACLPGWRRPDGWLSG